MDKVKQDNDVQAVLEEKRKKYMNPIGPYDFAKKTVFEECSIDNDDVLYTQYLISTTTVESDAHNHAHVVKIIEDFLDNAPNKEKFRRVVCVLAEKMLDHMMKEQLRIIMPVADVLKKVKEEKDGKK